MVDSQYAGYVKSAVIEEGITSVGEYAFYNCIQLTDILFPETLTLIDSYSFSGCSALEEITVDESNEYYSSVTDYAFSGNDSLTAVTLSDGLTSIGYEAFYSCDAIESIVIPESVTCIENSAMSAESETEFCPHGVAYGYDLKDMFNILPTRNVDTDI